MSAVAWLLFLVSVAGLDAGSSAPASQVAFREFVAPSPLAIAAPAQAGKDCLDVPEPAEAARVIAALDTELRKRGGFVLRPTALGGLERRANERAKPGSILRGGRGERLMVLGELQCGRPMPTFAIDRAGAVFAAEPVVQATVTRTLLSCQLECGGCGANLPPQPIVAEVPAGAHLEAPAGRAVKVPMDVHLVFTYPKDARCVPRP